ncbi:MAG: PDZ domain-containing protein [Vicinamibacterales bacterium]
MLRSIRTHVVAVVAVVALGWAGPARAQDFAGVFTFAWGDLRLEQNGSAVAGTYGKGNSGRPGKVTGTVKQSGSSRYVTGEYRDDGCSKGDCHGTIQLRFPQFPDVKELEFQYMPSYSSSWTRLWAKRAGTGATGTDGAVSGQPPSRPTTGGLLGGLKDKLLRRGTDSADRIVVPGGDAGTNNSEAAAIRYNCRINGELAQGDYDAFAFDFPGGEFLAESAGNLNLVADLIRASDGEVLARSGVDTTQFRIDGPLDAGRYILQVRVMQHAGAGPYAVALGAPGACVVEERAERTGGAVPSGAPDMSLGVQLEPGTGTFAGIGVRVVALTPGGHAERAGLRAGDVILSVDRAPVRGVSEAQGLRLPAGRPVPIVVVRNDRVISFEATAR